MSLTYQFSACPHCNSRWPGLRFTCPLCDWPRAHTDKVPVPEHAVGTPSTASPKGPEPDPILVVPVPQAPQMVLKEPAWEEVQGTVGRPVTAADLSQPLAQPQMLAVTPDDPVPPPEPAKPADLGLDAFDKPKPRKRKTK